MIISRTVSLLNNKFSCYCNKNNNNNIRRYLLSYRRLPAADHTSNGIQRKWTFDLNQLNSKGEYEKALALFNENVNQHNFKPNSFVFTSILRTCTKLKNLQAGKLIHEMIDNDIEVCNDSEKNLRIKTALIQMYLHCDNEHSIETVEKILNETKIRDEYLFCTLMKGK